MHKLRKKLLESTPGRALLFLLSLFYRLILLRPLPKPYRARVPVISVGNIVAGGTGKTPFTIMLAKEFQDVSILTRGYKSRLENSSGVLITAQTAVQEAGDEALLLQRNLPKAKIYVGKRRLDAAKKITSGCILLEDGFQHRAIARDLDIVLLDCSDPFGGGELLPLGTLREPLSELKRADLIVLNRVGVGVEEIEKKVRRYTEAPIIHTKMQFQGFVSQSGESVQLPKGPSGLFCGIGNPEQFVTFVESLGFEVKERLFLEDHEPVEESELAALYERVKAPILCTEKDMVKMEKSGLPVYAVRAEMVVTKGQERLQEMVYRTTLAERQEQL